MRTPHSTLRFLFGLLLVVQTGVSKAGTLPEAVKGIDDVVPKMCRVLELERSMYSTIRESGQTPEEFFARPDSDPDPKVQQVMRIARDIQFERTALTVAFGNLKGLVDTLRPEERASFNKQFELSAKQCSK